MMFQRKSLDAIFRNKYIKRTFAAHLVNSAKIVLNGLSCGYCQNTACHSTSVSFDPDHRRSQTGSNAHNNVTEEVHPKLSNSDLLPSNTFVPFKDVINKRFQEAKRSLVIQVKSLKSYSDLHNYCCEFGKISKMFHFTDATEQLHYVLVEFEKSESVTTIINDGVFCRDNSIIPVKSQFMWFHAVNSQSNMSKKPRSNLQLSTEFGCRILNNFQLEHYLASFDTISEQMYNLYEKTKLNELGIRLRFLTANQIIDTFSGILPFVTVLPFGSSVNSFGKLGCDLDLVLNFDDQSNNCKQNGRLMFHMKKCLDDERTQSQRFLEVTGNIMQVFLPGCKNVRKILAARVPILKYYHSFTNIECDVSVNNLGTTIAYYRDYENSNMFRKLTIKSLSGIVMSELLYIFSEFSNVTKPLVFAIRKWAQENELTNPSPGNWLSNFSITLLVLAFLQRTKPYPTLPTIDTIRKHSKSKQKSFDENDVKAGISFLNELVSLPNWPESSKSLELLLFEFFQYYSCFDFGKYAISLYDGDNILKPNHSPLYIINPLERSLNVSKNVSIEELSKFKSQCQNALWILEASIDNSHKDEHRHQCQTHDFGLLRLFKREHKPKMNSKLLHISKPENRLIEMSDIFENN